MGRHKRARRALRKVGMAAIKVRYPTDDDIAADPVGAMTVCMDAMRATLGLPKPEGQP